MSEISHLSPVSSFSWHSSRLFVKHRLKKCFRHLTLPVRTVEGGCAEEGSIQLDLFEPKSFDFDYKVIVTNKKACPAAQRPKSSVQISPSPCRLETERDLTVC
jgi:hypothetical protein